MNGWTSFCYADLGPCVVRVVDEILTQLSYVGSPLWERCASPSGSLKFLPGRPPAEGRFRSRTPRQRWGPPTGFSIICGARACQGKKRFNQHVTGRVEHTQRDPTFLYPRSLAPGLQALRCASQARKCPPMPHARRLALRTLSHGRCFWTSSSFFTSAFPLTFKTEPSCAS